MKMSSRFCLFTVLEDYYKPYCHVFESINKVKNVLRMQYCKFGGQIALDLKNCWTIVCSGVVFGAAHN